MNTIPATPQARSKPDTRSFPKGVRLLESREFRHATTQGKRRASPLFLVFFCKNNLSNSRLGLTVSKKVGNAVTRNRIKRWLRESFRHKKNRFNPPLDIVIIARTQASNVTHETFEAGLEKIFWAST